MALQLGFSHPDELTSRLTAGQLSEWKAYAAIEPFGEYRSELRHGQQMAMTANINRNQEARPEPFTALDFMNFMETEKPEPKEETPEELSRRISSELFKIG